MVSHEKGCISREVTSSAESRSEGVSMEEVSDRECDGISQANQASSKMSPILTMRSSGGPHQRYDKEKNYPTIHKCMG